MVDYLFKAQAVHTFGQGDQLLRFFAIYYAATSLVTFAIQATATRGLLERFGLAMTTSTPSLALLAGSVSSLFAPGFTSLIVARAGEAVFRGSFFRSGYELSFTPISSHDGTGRAQPITSTEVTAPRLVVAAAAKDCIPTGTSSSTPDTFPSRQTIVPLRRRRSTAAAPFRTAIRRLPSPPDIRDGCARR